MRVMAGVLLGVGLAWAGADDPPTADEEKAAAAAGKLPGATTSMPDGLRPGARVVVRLEKAGDKELTALAKLPGVGGIEVLDATKCTFAGLDTLKGLPHLRRLKLYQSGLKDERLPAVAACKELRELVLGQSKLTDAGLAPLSKLGRLEHLDLSDSPKVGDAGMAHVAKLERLEVLYLNKTAVGDKGLAALAPLEGLRVLSVAKAKVTEAAARAFEDEMPNLRKVDR